MELVPKSSMNAVVEVVSVVALSNQLFVELNSGRTARLTTEDSFVNI